MFARDAAEAGKSASERCGPWKDPRLLIEAAYRLAVHAVAALYHPLSLNQWFFTVGVDGTARGYGKGIRRRQSIPNEIRRVVTNTEDRPLTAKARSLRDAGRLVAGLTKLVEQLPRCTMCHAEGISTEGLVTGPTKTGEVAVMCERHFTKRGGVDGGL